MSERTGWDLVTAAQAGDSEAFGELWRRYQPLISHYIASLVRHRQTTDDLTSETFLRAFHRIGTIENQGRDVGAWFVTVARNIVYDHMKSSDYRRSNLWADITDAVAEPLEDGPDVTIPQQRADADAAQRLGWLVLALSPLQRDVIQYRYYDGRSIAETAALMGCEIGAVKATQHRATQTLARKARPARTVVEFVEGRAS